MRCFPQEAQTPADGGTPNAGTEGQEVIIFAVSTAAHGSQRFKSLVCFSPGASDGVSGPTC